jgi:hypothetical protein
LTDLDLIGRTLLLVGEIKAGLCGDAAWHNNRLNATNCRLGSSYKPAALFVGSMHSELFMPHVAFHINFDSVTPLSKWRKFKDL